MTPTRLDTTRDSDSDRGFTAPYPAPAWLRGPVLLPHVPAVLGETAFPAPGPLRHEVAPAEAHDT
ncbi:hypothetical protein [Streptomyces sp. NPDC047070]|uniref:hypothetical protein n=1 Tax=Streptomyces sp. NPDC047070 TaxID=3154923 RepID=UPI003452BD8E